MAVQTEAFPFLRIDVVRVKKNRKAIRIINRMLHNLGGKYIKNKPFAHSEWMKYAIEYPYNDDREKLSIESKVINALMDACAASKVDFRITNKPELGYYIIIDVRSDFSGHLRCIQVK